MGQQGWLPGVPHPPHCEDALRRVGVVQSFATMVKKQKQPKQPAPKPVVKKKKNKQQQVPTKTNANANAYYRALADPFSQGANGARVPDMYCCPTATRHITKTFTLTTNASGEADIIVLPSAFWHAASPRGSLASGATWTWLDGTVTSSAVQYTDRSTLAAQLVNHRIVGYGVKVFGIQSMTGTAGKVLGATVPISSWIADKTNPIGGQAVSSSNASGTRTKTLTAWGVPTSAGVVDIPSIPSLPNSYETSLVRVTENPIQIVPKITSPEAFNFRQSDDSAAGFNINGQTSATFVTSGDASYLRLSGHEAVIIAVAGASGSTNVLEVEVCYHLEGNPYQSTTGFAVIGNDGLSVSVDPINWMGVVQKVAQLPAFRDAVVMTGNTFFPGLGTLANRFF